MMFLPEGASPGPTSQDVRRIPLASWGSGGFASKVGIAEAERQGRGNMKARGKR